MSDAPALVSVIVPAYNHEKYVHDSVLSVINQDYSNIELIILNDGSKDATHEKIMELIPICEKRFTRFKYINKSNEGVATTLNQGIIWSEGEYVTVIASDDLMKPYKVSALVAQLENKGADYGLAFGDADFIDDRGLPLSLDQFGGVSTSDQGYSTFINLYTARRKDVVATKNYYHYESLLKGNYLPAMSVLWRKSALSAVGNFAEGMVLEDWDLWLKMSKLYKGVHIDKCVASYRWHDTNTVKTLAIPILHSRDIILKREMRDEKSSPAIKRIAARYILINTLRLIKQKQFTYMSNFIDVNIWRNL